jgi:hypothetical protein
MPDIFGFTNKFQLAKNATPVDFYNSRLRTPVPDGCKVRAGHRQKLFLSPKPGQLMNQRKKYVDLICQLTTKHQKIQFVSE